MTLQLLTPIYPPEFKPVRDGLYLTCRVESSGEMSVRTIRQWDSGGWRYEAWWYCPEQDWHWQGLAFSPGAALPTSGEIRQAVIDWQSGNSGYESVRMARAAQGER